MTLFIREAQVIGQMFKMIIDNINQSYRGIFPYEYIVHAPNIDIHGQCREKVQSQKLFEPIIVHRLQKDTG